MLLATFNKPFNFILFGASGDLAQLKLFPALYELVLQKRFAKDYSVTGFARSDMTHAEFRSLVGTSIKKHTDKRILDQKVLDEMLTHVYYHQGQYDVLQDFETLTKKLLEIHKGEKVYNLAYLAVPPIVFEPIAKNLASVCRRVGVCQMMMEKPFGHDNTSAEELFQLITSYFDKKDLF